ncbi:methyltransferase, FkbM family [Ruegeria halocynthiae]|uniref:Methyltransferase, FkbM family n=1 Tax=Ruegeria halocynthiae TaxID=985054 RepID=A0A1H2S0B9_9RHOB|nr:FkbM family methyltransferase [Ruegeria halocynthiae]SDW24998.1 methyltransferase, FkbM family [Ruegeria halocynthiae]
MILSNLPTNVSGRPWKSKRALRDFMLACLDAQSETVRVVQVGANDGKMEDPIWQYWSHGKWSGVLIEPHPVYFADLQALHDHNPKIELVNAAVSETDGTMALYHMAEHLRDECPDWLRGCASFDKKRMEAAVQTANRKNRLDIPQSAVVSTDVNVRRLDDILAELDKPKADLLVVDVEGHEVAVLASFDFSSLEAKAAIIECNAGNREEQQAIVSELNAAGMIAYQAAGDIIGLRPNAITIPIEAMFHFENMVPLAVDEQPVPTNEHRCDEKC